MSRADCAPAARSIALVWAFTVLVYWLQPQESIGLFPALSLVTKTGWATGNLLLCGLIWIRPGDQESLLAAAIFAFLTQLAWHSWLGALAPWIPWILLGLALLAELPLEQRRLVTEASLFLVLAFSFANKLTGAYYSGWEFGPEGMFSRPFPPDLKPFLAGHAAAAAIAWLALSALPLALFALRRRSAAAVAWAIHGLLATFLYNVLFYGIFLLVPLLRFVDPAFLGSWRWKSAGRFSPWRAYALGQGLFFAQYLWWKDVRWTCWLLVGLIAATLSLAAPPRFPVTAAWRNGSRLVRCWSLMLFTLLALALTTSWVPPPFLATDFSAREARFPPVLRIRVGTDAECPALTRGIAQRWGYRIFAADGECRAAVYR